MAFPVGVQTATVVFGKGVSVDGTPLASSLSIVPMFGGGTTSIVWVADGTPLIPTSATRQAESGNFGSIAIPVVDQAGWVDDGQNPFTMWAYRLTETVGGRTRVKYLQPVAGQSEIDFDRIPDGTVGLPVSAAIVPVSSVVGLTGEVSAQQVADAVKPLLPASGGGGVNSVNDKTGDVVLTAADIGAAAEGQGALAESAVQPEVLEEALLGKADAAQIIVLGVLDDGEVPPAPGIYLRRPA